MKRRHLPRLFTRGIARRAPCAALCMAAGLAGLASFVFAGTANRIVAIVNDAVITEADVASQVSALLEEVNGILPSEQDPSRMRQTVLERLIEKQLILQEAGRSNLSVRSEEVTERLEGLRSRFASEESFRRSLAEAGLSEERLKQELRSQLLVQKVIEAKVRSAISVSPQDVAQELERHPELIKAGDRIRASHILVRVDESRSEEAARALIGNIHEQLARGADFATLAKRYSEDSYGKAGGLMSWVAEGELLPELDATLFRLGQGELSEPIRSRLGFHLVRVEERRSAESLSVTEANRTVYQRLFQERFEKRFNRWLSQLKRGAYIELVAPETP